MPEMIVSRTLVASIIIGLTCGQVQVTQVQVLFRHGDRTPTFSEIHPNDIHATSAYEPWGLGQMTNEGKMREYRIGQLLKERYKNLLGPLYFPSMVHAVSTDTDRTKISLQLVLAGLFPPSEIQTWNSELPWLPIPIHHIPAQIDILMNSFLCPEYQKAMDEVKRRPEVHARISAFNDLFEFLSIETGRNITDPSNVYEIYCLLVSQRGMNLTLPQWYTEPVFQRIKDCVILFYQIKLYTTELKRLNGGSLVRKFIQNMRLEGVRNNSRKIYLYSGHDMNVLSFLRAHGILEPEQPFFGTAVMFEKLEDSEENRFVRMVLWTGVTEQLITLRLPGCEEICPIERYLQLTRDVIPTDEEMHCHLRRLSIEELYNLTDQ